MSFPLFSQTEISGKTSGHTFSYKPTYERGVPPNLFVDMSFADDNGNGILECSESANLKLQITNKGKGKAQGLKILIKDSFIDKNFTIGETSEIYFIQPDKTVDVEIPIKAGFDIKTADSGNGLGNMSKRAEALHGTIDIISNLGKGTEIILTVPVKR